MNSDDSRKITEAFAEFVGDSAEVVVEGADRHGAYQWIARWKSAGLDRYVEWDIAADPAVPGSVLSSEAWVAAELDDRYTRLFVGLTQGFPFVGEDVFAGPKMLLSRASKVADSFQLRDLQSEYPQRGILAREP